VGHRLAAVRHADVRLGPQDLGPDAQHRDERAGPWLDPDGVEVTKNERRKNSIGQKRRTEHKLWTQMVAYSNHPFTDLDKAWEQALENRMNEGFRTADDLIADAVAPTAGRTVSPRARTACPTARPW
jgi:hypothetical protein